MFLVISITESVYCCLFMCRAEMDLFAVVKLEKPKQVAVGVRPLKENEEAILDATTGYTTVFAQAGPEDSPPIAVLVTPV